MFLWSRDNDKCFLHSRENGDDKLTSIPECFELIEILFLLLPQESKAQVVRTRPYKSCLPAKPCQHQLNTVIGMYALRFFVEIREAIQNNFIVYHISFFRPFSDQGRREGRVRRKV